MDKRKYEITGEKIEWNGHVLYRIRALQDFIRPDGLWIGTAGEIGGWIENERNLSQSGSAWIDGSAKVYDCARVIENAMVYDHAQVFAHAQISGNARIYGHAIVSGKAKIYGHADISEDAVITGAAVVFDYAQVAEDAWIGGNTKVHGHAFVHCEAVIKTGDITGHVYARKDNQ